MKNKNIFHWLCLCLWYMSLNAFAQTTRITYPINGMVIQQSTNGTANVPLAAVISGVDTQYTQYGQFRLLRVSAFSAGL